MICIDTNIVIAVINRRNPMIRARLGEQLRSGTSIVLPVIALYEIRYGIAKSDRRPASEKLLEEFLASEIKVAPFEPEDAAHAGEIRAHLEGHGTPIGYYDYLIAAQARRRGAILATSNGREFARVPGLIVTDWGI
jgi:tRNA(fMet)-specific endonuclease VapC